MKIVFMGTPEFAVKSLQKLYQSHHKIVGVVTVPDKPQGRGQKLAGSAVKIEAEHLGIPVLQPDNLEESSFIDALRTWQADCFAVVAFRILPEVVYEMPFFGTVNLHASLLPKYRGAAPIQWALMNGDTETGVTTFLIQKKVDTGDILLQKKVSIHGSMNAGDLHDALATAGADLMKETMDGIADRNLKAHKQASKITKAPKILQSHCLIEWTRSAEEINNQIRALAPQPGAFTCLHGKRLKIFQASPGTGELDAQPGQIVRVGQDSFTVSTGKGLLNLEILQIQGKKKMSTGDFLRGFSVKVHDLLGEKKKEKISYGN